MTRLGENISYWLEKRGMNTTQLAKRAGISHGYLSELINDVKANPGLDKLQSIAQGLRVTLSQLVEERAGSGVKVAVVEDFINADELVFKSMLLRTSQVKLLQAIVEDMLDNFEFWDTEMLGDIITEGEPARNGRNMG